VRGPEVEGDGERRRWETAGSEPHPNGARERSTDEVEQPTFEALSGNPGRGSGAKQTHKAESGARRRREKRQDGQATGNGKPVVTTRSARVAKRDLATPWEELCACSHRVEAWGGQARSYSEEE